METRHKNTDTRTLSCGRVCAKLILTVALFIPALVAFRGFPENGKTRKVTEIVKIVEVVEKPRPKELVKVYNIVKSHRSDITDSEAWRVSEAILEESLKRHLDPMLVLAVIEIESRFQYSAWRVAGGCARHHANHARHRQVFDRRGGARIGSTAGRLPARIPRRSDLEYSHGRLLSARSQKTISQSQSRLDRIQRRAGRIAEPLGEQPRGLPWDVAGTLALSRNETFAGEPLLERTQYQLWTTWSPTAYLSLSGSWWYTDDSGRGTLNQTYNVSYAPGARLTVSATFQGCDDVGGIETSTDSLSATYRLFTQFLLFANLSRSATKDNQGETIRVSNFRAGLQLAF